MDPSGQIANVSGENNVAVNAVNSVVTIGSDARRLTLTLYDDRAQAAAKVGGEAALLSAYRTDIVDLVGRDAEMAALQAWLADASATSARVLIGSAGRGKTRLAGEFARAARRVGWDAGFVGAEDFEAFAAARGKDWPRKKPTLVMLDYAAGRGRALQGWLDELANAPKSGLKLRLLLLERQAGQEIGWLAELIGRGGDKARARAALFDPTEPVELAPLGEAEWRRALFWALFKRGGGKAEAGADFDARLAEPKWGGDPLFLMMAGLVAAKAGVADALSLSRADLAFEVADWELERIGRIGAARGIDRDATPPGRSLRRLAALTTLVQGLSVVEARRLAEALRLGGDPEAMMLALRDALPRAEAGAGIGPILPDMVGEAAILRIYGDGGEIAGAGGETDAPVLAAAATAILAASATLVRAAQDFAAAGHLAPIRWLEALADAPETDLGALMQIANALPDQTLALRETAARLLGKICDLLVALKQATPKADVEPPAAAALNNLGNRLSALGQRGAALAAAQEAVAIYRRLAAERPDAFLPVLSASLMNLGNRLGDLGRRKAALAAAQEAVKMYRRLAAERPDTFQPGLASSLSTLGNILSALGQHEAALAAAEEAVAIRRRLTAERPDAFLSDLAASLNNLGAFLSNCGRRETALAVAQEAVAIRRCLAAERPDAFLPDLAMSLSNLGNRLSALDRREAALAAAQEAVAIRRRLAAEQPDAFLPDLARSLNNLSNSLSDLDRREEALAAAEEAVRVFAPLFLRLPLAHANEMVTAGRNYIERAKALGQEPDWALLAPGAKALQALQTSTPEPET